jgi:uncharacterized protein (TIGR02145 family)
MKKALLTLMCIVAMMAAGTSLKAQEVTIVLMPGWTWISIPSTDTLDFATALGSFTPAEGDKIKSQWGNATYMGNGQWRGSISQFYPGYGYMYKSTRTIPVMLTFNVQQPDPQGDDHEYVDLGLPSGTLWATINVGANAPEEYGDYFAWGEISPKDYYDWSNYQHSINNGSTLIKYVYPSSYVQYQIIDSLTVLMPEDDAATANWGEDWRMPTKEEWQELYQSTSHEWTTQDGVNGILFTAQNGNSIFLPAAGAYSQSGLNYESDQGMYWSSNLVTDFVSSLAWCFRFMTDDYAMIYGQRQYGYPIRPVRPGVPNPSFIIDATADPAEGGEVTGGGAYQEGDECTLTATPNEGYTFTNWTENDEVVSTDATYTFIVSTDRTLVANFIYVPSWSNGVLPGVFSVSATQQVNFSQGNLQYQASANTWCFAENQWDVIGTSQGNNSQSTTRDLFGWGTSGWNCGNTYYHPWDTDNSNTNLYGPPGSYNLTGSYINSDWGYYNLITNGGNTTHQWRTLTHDEWVYVFYTRSGISYAKAQITGISNGMGTVNGVILFPDNWSTDTYNPSNYNQDDANYSSNTIPVTQWYIIEAAGAVFLPAAGSRDGTSVSNVDIIGGYWTASCYLSHHAYGVAFSDSGLNTNSTSRRYYGKSVRLVCSDQ